MNKQSAWPTVRLKDVIVDMQPGFARRPNPDERGTPQLRPNNISPEGLLDLSAVKYVQASSSELEKYSVQKGDVIFNNTNSLEWVGKTAYLDSEERFAISNHMTRIRVNSALLDAEFLARYLHYLWKIGLPRRWAKQWVNQAAIDQAGLAQFPVPLPTLLEQRHIVTILRQADELRRLRKVANDKSRNVLFALFYDMFGDPVGNKRKWGKNTLSKIVAEDCPVTYGIVQPGDEVLDGVPIVRPINMVHRTIDVSSLKRIRKDIAKRYSRSQLKGKELLISVRGQLGALSITEPDLEGANVTRGVVSLWFKPDIQLVFMYGLLGYPSIQQVLQSMAIGMALKQINLGDLRNLQIPVPPLHLQREFTEKAFQIWDIENQQVNAFQLLNDLRSSLQAKSFSADLTAVWRETHLDELQEYIVQRDTALSLLVKHLAALDLTDDETREIFARQIAALTAPAVHELLDVLENQRQLDFSQQYNFIALAEQIHEALPQYAAQVRDVLFAVVANLNYGLQKSLSEQRARLSELTSNTLDNVVVQDTAHFHIVLALALSNAAVAAQEISAQKTAPQAGREVRKAFSSKLQTLLHVAEARPAYFHPGDLVHDEIDLAAAEEGLYLLTALGFVRPVRIEGKKAYCLVYDGQEPISAISERS